MSFLAMAVATFMSVGVRAAEDTAVSSVPSQRVVLLNIHLDAPEFVQLYNPSSAPAVLDGVSLVFMPAKGKEVELARLDGQEIAPMKTLMIGQHADAVVAFAKQNKQKDNIIQLNGQIELRDGQQREVVSFGEKSTASLKVTKKRLLQRCAKAAGALSMTGTTADFMVMKYDNAAPLVQPLCTGVSPAPPSSEPAQPADPPSGSDPSPQPPQDPPNNNQPTPPGSDDSVTPQQPAPPPPPNTCEHLRINEIAVKAARGGRRFIELKNAGATTVMTGGCSIATKQAKSHYVLPDAELPAGALMVIDVTKAKLKLDSAGDSIYLLNGAGNEVQEVAYREAPAGASWGLHDDEWRWSYAVTPDKENVYQACRDGYEVTADGCRKIVPPQPVEELTPCPSGWYRSPETKRCRKIPEVKPPVACPVGQERSAETGRCRKIVAEKTTVPCPAGQVRNPETGRCRKLAATKVVTPCKEGYYRSEATGRCRSIASVAAKTLKPCPDGEFRNPATGRCKKIAAASDIAKECPEGFERNPATNRCRKIQSATPPKADFKPEPVQEVAGAVWGWWVAGGVGLLAAGYGVWQWRWEFGQLLRRMGAAFTSGKK
ncbi:MAG: lamin tail domain-containing protein [Candidatus Saccharibacteria bacterium]|nr:lamin tail domain-containing protein [Candidatus Saccharibacteria bacterium]